MKAKVKIAVVGDVHDQWETKDRIALERMGIDLVLFVGNFGNEAIAAIFFSLLLAWGGLLIS
ncbi:hypothetical protein [Okeania sp. SIO2C9]|uniref:hypothetical protein n=1 Tax=Okeania sp. SIO2C9 TaxID=2607791 RepID=UPI0035C8C5C4